jgi:hypothetical protein
MLKVGGEKRQWWDCSLRKRAGMLRIGDSVKHHAEDLVFLQTEMREGQEKE